MPRGDRSRRPLHTLKFHRPALQRRATKICHPCRSNPNLGPPDGYRFSGAALTYGAAPHVIEGVTVRITTPAKTVTDCFKYRNKISLDVALEALRDCYRERKASLDEIWEAAKVCRMANVIRPYMESLT